MSQGIRCSFKYVDKEKRDNLKYSSCLLTISVGQEYHEEDKFLATIRLINSTFKSCKIMLYDTLQRYTMALQSEHSPDFFQEAALKEGNYWLERNKKHYSELQNLDGIIRWDYWLQHSNFQHYYDIIKKELNTDSNYSSVFYETIRAYLGRYVLHHHEKIDMTRAKGLCLNYLIEECAALCLWPETGCDFEVYPARRNLAMDATHKKFILKYTDTLQSIGIKFGGINRIRPQRFQSDFGVERQKEV